MHPIFNSPAHFIATSKTRKCNNIEDLNFPNFNLRTIIDQTGTKNPIGNKFRKPENFECSSTKYALLIFLGVAVPNV